ncbi:MAG: DUF3781 domain-containing protein [Candidatus Vecturithrix sp.]|jgi:hypothetical protein|nr:DUF3781 domain-containing protein [Candidatus Vecturithrix sp.]
MIPNDNELLAHIEKIHTTEQGYIRIKNNLELDTDDIIAWCINAITSRNCRLLRKGKNWYADIDDIAITINAYSFTIITAHRK